MVRNYNDKELLAQVKNLKTFKEIPAGYWILGVRCDKSKRVKDKFNCKFYIFNGEKCILVMTGTTVPGVWSLLNFKSYGATGSALIKSDEWYYDVWKRGNHKEKIPALVQVGRFKVIRDNDRNLTADETNHFSFEINKGLNFHVNTYLGRFVKVVKSWFIGKWSLGCQVTNDKDKYYEFLEISEPQKIFTYCLINEF